MPQVVITVHGANTIGDWQMEAHPVFSGIHDFFYHPYHYGRFWPQRVASAHDRLTALERFYRHYMHVRRQRGVVPSMIAHSFGTYLVSQAFERYPLFELDRLVLCGSIVQRDYNWSDRPVRQVRHDIALRDWVAKGFRVFRRVIPGTGSSGIDGFSVCNHRLFEFRFPDYGHSTVINRREHCRDIWLPFLRDTEVFKRRCDAVLQRRDDALSARFASDYFPLLDRAWGRTGRSLPELLEAARILLKAFANEGASGRYHEGQAALVTVQEYCEKYPPWDNQRR